MYTHPATAEQCLHNALKVISALRYIGIDYDIHVRKNENFDVQKKIDNDFFYIFRF